MFPLIKSTMEVACSDPTIPDGDVWKIYYCKSYIQVK